MPHMNMKWVFKKIHYHIDGRGGNANLDLDTHDIDNNRVIQGSTANSYILPYHKVIAFFKNTNVNTSFIILF